MLSLVRQMNNMKKNIVEDLKIASAKNESIKS